MMKNKLLISGPVSRMGPNYNALIEDMQPLPSGAVGLLSKGFFPWGALPYPKEHAELGTCLVQCEDPLHQKIGYQMATFQEATLDHTKNPIRSIFQQEKFCDANLLSKANQIYFAAIKKEPADSLQFHDASLAIVARRTTKASCIFLGSGCKSGMGSFFFQDSGIVNFGPQLLPIGDCSGFGIAGRAQKIELQETLQNFSLSYLNRLSSPHPSKRTYYHLQDSGYSRAWIEAEIKGSLEGVSISSHFEAMMPLNNFVFSFFGKAACCLVAGLHKIRPRSLDRYQGPAQPVAFMGTLGQVKLDPKSGALDMQIIPLAGDESFWGADFLVAYSLASPEVTFSIELLHN